MKSKGEEITNKMEKNKPTYQEVMEGSIIWWILGFSCIPLGIILRDINGGSVMMVSWLIGAGFIIYPMIKYPPTNKEENKLKEAKEFSKGAKE